VSSFFSLETLGAFALVLGLLVLIHELGHFLVAKWLGVHVEVFSIGFGPALLGFRFPKSGMQVFAWGRRLGGPSGDEGPEKPGLGPTEYRISLLPLGGYVKMLGENPEESVSGDPREFLSRSKPQRFAVLVMGATANILAAVALMTVVYLAGVPEPAFLTGPAVVGAVSPDSPAARAGILPGDRILRLGREAIASWQDLVTSVTLSPGQTIEIELERGGEIQRREITLESVSDYEIGYAGILPVSAARILHVEPRLPAAQAGLRPGDRIVEVNGLPVGNPEVATRVFQESAGVPVALAVERGTERLGFEIVPVAMEGAGRIGIHWDPLPEQEIRKYPLGAAIGESVKWNWRNVDLVFTTLRKLFTREISLRTMSGPIDIYKFSGQTFRQGWIQFLQFMALVSLQLGVINLLPFPVLDGGHILILFVEGVIRRDLSLRIKERVMQVGFYLLLLLMGTIVYLDIAKNSNNFEVIRDFFR
jgi:regulator of sigma E protease